MPEHAEMQQRQLADAAEQREIQPDDNGELLDEVIESTTQNPSLDDFKVQPVRAAASFDVAAPAGHHLYWIAMNGKHTDLADARMQKLSVVNWIIYCKEVVRKDGSIDPAGMVTCLFLHDGRTVSWASPTTNKQWCSVTRIKGTGPYSPPLDIVLVPNPSQDKDKSPWYSILPWGSDEANAAIKAWKERN